MIYIPVCLRDSTAAVCYYNILSVPGRLFPKVPTAVRVTAPSATDTQINKKDKVHHPRAPPHQPLGRVVHQTNAIVRLNLRPPAAFGTQEWNTCRSRSSLSDRRASRVLYSVPAIPAIPAVPPPASSPPPPLLLELWWSLKSVLIASRDSRRAGVSVLMSSTFFSFLSSTREAMAHRVLAS